MDLKQRKKVSTFQISKMEHACSMDLLPDSMLLLEMNYSLFEIPDFFYYSLSLHLLEIFVLHSFIL